MESSELKIIADFCRKNWVSQTNKIIEIADAVCENRFLFGMPWDLERTEEEVCFDSEINWYSRVNGDDEFLYQLNRHGFLSHLGQAFVLTDDSKYAECFCRILQDWIERVPCDNGKKSPWRSLEVSIRAMNWLKAIPLVEFTEFYTDSLCLNVEKSLKKHSEVLIAEHQAFHKGSNWGVIQDSGLFAISAYFKDKNNMQLAAERLDEETRLQVMDDGVHWEQSSGYHNAVLVELLDVLRIAENEQFVLPDTLKENIFKMAFVNLKWIRPDGRHPLFGDSDNNDIRDILSRSALLFKNSNLKSRAFSVLDYDSAWLFGKKGIDEYNKLESCEPDFLNAFLFDSGNYILRSDWGEKANWLCFHNGYTGGGHAHADKLHFDLMLSGKDILTDGGRYSYKPCSERLYLKNAEGHNTSIVGNIQFLKAVGAWGVRNPALSLQNSCIENKHCVLLVGGHLGYLKSKSVYTERRILWIKPDIYIIIDTFFGGLFHKYRQFFHFNHEGAVRLEKNKAIYTDKDLSACMHFISDGVRLKKTRSLYSPNYNALIENEGVETSFCGIGNRTAITVIGNCEAKHINASLLANGKKLKANAAEGIYIKTEKSEYTVCLAHRELKTPFTCNDKTATGRLAVFCDDKLIFKKW